MLAHLNEAFDSPECHLDFWLVSRTYIAWCLTATSLPVLAGRLYDLTGGYEIAVIVAGSGNLLAVLVALTLPRQKLAQ